MKIVPRFVMALMSAACMLGAQAVSPTLAPTDAYAGPSKPMPVRASSQTLAFGGDYQLAVKPAQKGSKRIGSVFVLQTPAQDTWLSIEASSAQAGFSWGVCDLKGRSLVTALTKGSGAQRLLLKAKRVYALYFEALESQTGQAEYTVRLRT